MLILVKCLLLQTGNLSGINFITLYVLMKIYNERFMFKQYNFLMLQLKPGFQLLCLP
jgi:hypothetical protein